MKKQQSDDDVFDDSDDAERNLASKAMDNLSESFYTVSVPNSISISNCDEKAPFLRLDCVSAFWRLWTTLGLPCKSLSILDTNRLSSSPASFR